VITTIFRRVLLFSLALLAGSAPALAEAPPTRIVSINLCADELLLALADPVQIAALSIYATDADLSTMAEAAKGFRHDAAAAETVVDLHPDLVLAGRYTKRATRDMLKRLGYRLVELDAASSIAASIGQIRQVAALVGHAERGEALVGAIEAARDRALASAGTRRPVPTAAFFQRRGYVTGGATLTGELMGIVGLANEGGALAGKSGGFVPLERLVAAPPDLLVVDAADSRAEDQGTALLAHPALTELYPPEKRIILPGRLTVCGGPSLPAALDWLSSEARRVTGTASP
jgi:iron complex transport system substrate-binding protein